MVSDREIVASCNGTSMMRASRASLRGISIPADRDFIDKFDDSFKFMWKTCISGS
ncbi:hypothetical protein Syun_001313 [Stephania yunnanensis]|uniref:Uncharacterized protein n=1 Tax=Stephania yunnanensis TaxID=152371 RepID=A0AAP0LEL1_9MAGN